MTASAQQRLPRLLSLVPYFLARPGILITEAAADFGITEQQLRKDLELLWMCGLPGYGPGDLIDLSFDGDSVTVTYDAGMRRPLRLTTTEATALLVALRALADTPGVVDADAVRRAVAKIEAAVGQAQPAGVVVGLHPRESKATAEVREPLQESLQQGCAVRIRYYTPARDELSDRVVDPMRLLVIDGRNYLEAWCRKAEDVRLFRLDRIDEVALLAERAQPPVDAQPTDVVDSLYQPRSGQSTAVLILGPDARWITEYYQVDSIEDLPDGQSRVRMRYDEQAWMARVLLGLGSDVTVEEPRELAEYLRAQAEAGLRRLDAVAVSS